MTLQKNIILRHQSAGYIRFAMPAGFDQAPLAQALAQGIRQFRGVYRVDFSTRTRKLSIRFDDTATDFHSIACALYDLVTALATQIRPAPESINQPVDNIAAPLKISLGGGWVGEKIQEVKETITAMGLVIRNRLGGEHALINDPEKIAIEFFNDVIVLYLIKLHWHLITQHWLRKPFQYRYEWMGVLYLIYLLVRAKQAAFRNNDEQQN